MIVVMYSIVVKYVYWFI